MSEAYKMTNINYMAINVQQLKDYLIKCDERVHRQMEEENQKRRDAGCEYEVCGSICREGYLNSVVRSGDFEVVHLTAPVYHDEVLEDFLMCEVGKMVNDNGKIVIRIGEFLYINFNDFINSN